MRIMLPFFFLSRIGIDCFSIKPNLIVAFFCCGPPLIHLILYNFLTHEICYLEIS